MAGQAVPAHASSPTSADPPTPAPTQPAPSPDAPATSTPATAAPATSTPATPAPATSTPATAAPATSAPATPAPATETPTSTPQPDFTPQQKPTPAATPDPAETPEATPQPTPDPEPDPQPTKAVGEESATPAISGVGGTRDIPEEATLTAASLAEVANRIAARQGTVYTWQDGEQTRRVRVVPGLFVQDSASNAEGDRIIVDYGQRSVVL